MLLIIHKVANGHTTSDDEHEDYLNDADGIDSSIWEWLFVLVLARVQQNLCLDSSVQDHGEDLSGIFNIGTSRQKLLKIHVQSSLLFFSTFSLYLCS